jgi:hypothetical protein
VNRELVVVWSGATERAGTAQFALSSPLIGSAARLCVELGSHRTVDGGPRQQDKPLPKRRCRTCLRLFQPPTALTGIKNVVHCADCTSSNWSGLK